MTPAGKRRYFLCSARVEGQKVEVSWDLGYPRRSLRFLTPFALSPWYSMGFMATVTQRCLRRKTFHPGGGGEKFLEKGDGVNVGFWHFVFAAETNRRRAFPSNRRH